MNDAWDQLLRSLPAPGTQWPHEDRAKWLADASRIFDALYGKEDRARALPAGTNFMAT